MLQKIYLIVFIITGSNSDLQTAAVTVYRNPEFFRHLSEEFNNHLHTFTTDPPGHGDEYQGAIDDSNYFHQYNTEFNPEYSPTNEEYNNDENNEEDDENEHQKELNDEEEEEEDYKYPGEPKKPNPSDGKPDVNVHYDPSPDFNAPPRKLEPTPPAKKPKGRGPYGHPRHAQDKYTTNNHNYDEPDYDHGQLESIPDNYEDPIVNEPEEYLGYENAPHYETIRETKKGTREFLKHNTLPSNHELEDLRSVHQRQHHHNCATRIKMKKPRTFVAYKLRPLYPRRYRVVPLKPVYFINNLIKRRRHVIKPIPDDSAYLTNSAYDDDYQRIIRKPI